MAKDRSETEKEKEKSGGILSFFKKVESDITKWFLGILFTMIGLAIPFYFNTTTTMEAHSTKLNVIQTQVSTVQESVTKLEENPGMNGEQIVEIKKIVEEIQVRQQRLEQRQDKMYDLMLEIAKGTK